MKRVLAVLLITAFAPAFAASTAEWRVNLVRTGGASAGTFKGDTLDQAAAACRAAAEALGARASGYDCQTPRMHVAVTADVPVCPAQPAIDTQPGSCPAGTAGTWSQSRSYVSAAYPTCWTAGPWTPATAPPGTCSTIPVDPAPASGQYTDLASAPTCARVTVYPQKTVTDAAGAGIPTHAGNCFEATPADVGAKFAALKPGDVLYLHAGTYTGVYGEGSWYGNSNFETYKKGTAAQPIAVVAYPGDAVTLKPAGRPSLIFGDGTRNSNHAEYLTFAGMSIVASQACASGGGDTTVPSGGPDETGGRYIRLVAINCSITDATSNTMTGLVDVQGDGWKILGSKFRDPANRVVINNNHGLYLQGGADDLEIGWNDIQIHGGAQIQVHQDGTPKLVERLNIHDNVIGATNYGDGRGISVINIADASTVSILGNRISHQGQGVWGCLALYRGQITIDGLDCTDTQGPPIGLNGQYGGTRKVTISNSKLCSTTTASRVTAENGASLSQATETGAKACP